MSFDPRSLERLQELGRQLPKPLEPPTPQPQAKPQRQHRVETEEDPEELFRQLMQVSPDGTVPEHLMARLRQLEAERKRQPLQPGSKPTATKKGTNRVAANQDDSLYSEFEQMLLEEDDA
ncbi:MAG: hypothetical protein MPI81_02390 [Synechococcus sp. H1_metabat_bins_2.tsv.006]|nr:hypothetical protein [Synechococcus sp. H1_metabat_bins_2.tsv.006]